MMKEYIAKQGQTLEEIAWILDSDNWEYLFTLIMQANPDLVDPDNIFLKGGEKVLIPEYKAKKAIPEVSLW